MTSASFMTSAMARTTAMVPNLGAGVRAVPAGSVGRTGVVSSATRRDHSHIYLKTLS